MSNNRRLFIETGLNRGILFHEDDTENALSILQRSTAVALYGAGTMLHEVPDHIEVKLVNPESISEPPDNTRKPELTETQEPKVL